MMKEIIIDQSCGFMKVEKVDIYSEYFYLSPFNLNEESKEVKHDTISDETT